MKLNFKNRGLWIDIVNMILGLVIIVLAIIAIHNGNGGGDTFAVVFFLGAVMFFLNAVKEFPGNRFRAVLFLIITVILLTAGLISSGLIGAVL